MQDGRNGGSMDGRTIGSMEGGRLTVGVEVAAVAGRKDTVRCSSWVACLISGCTNLKRAKRRMLPLKGLPLIGLRDAFADGLDAVVTMILLLMWMPDVVMLLLDEKIPSDVPVGLLA